MGEGSDPDPRNSRCKDLRLEGALCVKETAQSLMCLQLNESGVHEIKRGCGWRQAADSREVREDWVLL